MASRKLGGGRILGSGKSLAPPAPVHHRSSSLLTPSESEATGSVTSESQDGGSPLGTSPLAPIPDHLLSNAQDITSRVSLDRGGSPAPAVASKLVCPICAEEMMTLLQLNRHLDDNHQELPAVQQDEVKNWFDKQVLRAKKFQPLAVINQKLKGLDVFESNDIPSVTSYSNSSPSRNVSPPRQIDQPPNPDEVVTRTHWQKTGYNDVCTEPVCGKRLGPVNGTINCRHCGRLFCEDHTMYQMKLSRSAQHEPVRGMWCRVCETCYKSREGYNDHHGHITDHTSTFTAMRRRTVDKQYLEISRLEKRLTKLTQLLANPPEAVNTDDSFLNPVTSLSGQKNNRKLLEQSVVTWEEDSKVSKCPFCLQEFGSWTFRRSHCRLCGRVVCSDIRTACSTEVGLDVESGTNRQSEKSPVGLSLDIRMCKECRTTVFSRKDYETEVSTKPQDQRLYENMLQFEKGIRSILAIFQKSLVKLQDPDKPPSSQELAEAAKVRKRLIDSFGKYDLLAKRIRDLPTQSVTQAKVQKNIYGQASNFLHIHMLPLKALPKILKHASPHGQMQHQPSALRNGSALSQIRYNDMDSASQVSSSSAVSALEAEEKELRERLIVLEEQRFMVGEMVEEARKKRRFDEVKALLGNVEDLEREIDSVQGMLGNLDFEGVYNGAQLGTAST